MELVEMMQCLKPLRLLGLTSTNDEDDGRISHIEELYLNEFRHALQNTPYEVLSQAYLDGMECDVIITEVKSTPTSCDCDSTNSYHSTQTIVANIEIDGPHHKQPKKLQYTRLRDEYFQQHHGVSVRRVNASMEGGKFSKKHHVAETVQGILKELKLI
jgi:hypothetical protein